jgi:membrane-associated phospholipid phosphatase
MKKRMSNMTQFERTYKVMKNPFLILLYSLLVILVWFTADKPLTVWFYPLDLNQNASWLNIFSVLGQWKYYLILLPVLGLFWRIIYVNRIYEMRSWYLLSCLVFSNAVCFLLKNSLSRARPVLFFHENLFGFYWFQFQHAFASFPSGHAITTAALASGLGVIFPRYFYVFACVSIMVCISRVMLLNHYLSDVLVGFYLGVLLVGMLTQFLKKKRWLISE